MLAEVFKSEIGYVTLTQNPKMLLIFIDTVSFEPNVADDKTQVLRVLKTNVSFYENEVLFKIQFTDHCVMIPRVMEWMSNVSS